MPRPRRPSEDTEGGRSVRGSVGPPPSLAASSSVGSFSAQATRICSPGSGAKIFHPVMTGSARQGEPGNRCLLLDDNY
jgi:hypothetical protein